MDTTGTTSHDWKSLNPRRDGGKKRYRLGCSDRRRMEISCAVSHSFAAVSRLSSSRAPVSTSIATRVCFLPNNVRALPQQISRPVKIGILLATPEKPLLPRMGGRVRLYRATNFGFFQLCGSNDRSVQTPYHLSDLFGSLAGSQCHVASASCRCSESIYLAEMVSLATRRRYPVFSSLILRHHTGARPCFFSASESGNSPRDLSPSMPARPMSGGALR